MIQLGLERITKLLANAPLKWKAIHVAGTNGKGSVCAAASDWLRKARDLSWKVGRYTSPHLIDRWDCITIGQNRLHNPVDQRLFEEVEQKVKSYDKQHGINATPFEILTATAFEVFNVQNVDIAVIEVGMGGLTDATNVVDPVVTVITKVALDHQGFLGSSIEDIARQKAGIIKSGVPCIVDSSNEPGVLAVIEEVARANDAPLILYPTPGEEPEKHFSFGETGILSQKHMRINRGLAWLACQSAINHFGKPLLRRDWTNSDLPDMLPGRQQQIHLEAITGRSNSVLLDGAHNPDAALALCNVIPQNEPVTWMIATTKGKDVRGIFGHLLKGGDNVVAVEFGPVDGMPWIAPMPSAELLDAVRSIAKLNTTLDGGRNVLDAVKNTAEIAQDAPMVITGSLYLVSDILRLQRDYESTT